jgi:hypothetical protein
VGLVDLVDLVDLLPLVFLVHQALQALQALQVNLDYLADQKAHNYLENQCLETLVVQQNPSCLVDRYYLVDPKLVFLEGQGCLEVQEAQGAQE